MNVNNEGLFQFLAETTSPCFPSASTFNLLWKLTCWITFKFFIMFQYLYFSAEFSQSCFKRVLIGSAAISALRLHQRLPVRLYFFIIICLTIFLSDFATADSWILLFSIFLFLTLVNAYFVDLVLVSQFQSNFIFSKTSPTCN